jgi:nitrogen regulatory protein PII
VKHSPVKYLGFIEMKKIEAVILPSRLNAVSAELRRCGIHAELTLTGVQQGDGSHHDVSAEENGDGSLRHLVKLELIVGDRQAQRAVNVILKHSQSDSNEGGGHIAVLDVSEALQILAPLILPLYRVEETPRTPSG